MNEWIMDKLKTECMNEGDCIRMNDKLMKDFIWMNE